MMHSSEVQELISNYLAMNPWARQKYRQTGVQYALDFPAPRVLLTLVEPAEDVEVLPRQVNGDFNSSTVVLIRQPIDR